MRATIAGFLTASLYTLVIATLMGMSMPTQAELRVYIEAARAAPAHAMDVLTD
jgi:ABC-type nitrate/sulfonate/bicarbonate transport system permease component